MNYEQKGQGIVLSDQDRRQLEGVRQEISKGVLSMVRIVAATLGLAPEFPATVSLSVSMEKLSPSHPLSPDEIKVTCDVEFPDGTKACYQDPPGICCGGPCPC